MKDSKDDELNRKRFYLIFLRSFKSLGGWDVHVTARLLSDHYSINRAIQELEAFVTHAALIWDLYFCFWAGHGSRVVWGMYCLRSLETRDRGFESHTKYGCLVCMHLFCVCVVLCLGRDLATR
jgi:hypothetical protein